MKSFKVGVFPIGKSGRRFTAYTTWYNPTWDGCCEHTVSAANGTIAKQLAIAEHKARCVPLAYIATGGMEEQPDGSVHFEEYSTPPAQPAAGGMSYRKPSGGGVVMCSDGMIQRTHSDLTDCAICEPAAGGGEALFYVLDTRSMVGNCATWWAAGGGGYVCDLRNAGKFRADEHTWRETDVLVPCEVAEANVVHHVRADERHRWVAAAPDLQAAAESVRDQQADAWKAVFDALRAGVPGFLDLAPNGAGCALAAIRGLLRDREKLEDAQAQVAATNVLLRQALARIGVSAEGLSEPVGLIDTLVNRVVQLEQDAEELTEALENTEPPVQGS